MPNITTVNLTAGVPSGPAGASTASTIDALMADGGQATIGITTGAAVSTDAPGTLQQYLRGLVKAIVATGTTASPSTTLLSMAPAAVAAGGATNLHFFSVAGAPAAVVIKGSGGNLYGVQAVNTSASPVYLKLYNLAAASVVVGTTVPLVTIPVPTTATTGSGIAIAFPVGIAFSTAISYTFTNLAADNDATAVAVGTTFNIQFA